MDLVHYSQLHLPCEESFVLRRHPGEDRLRHLHGPLGKEIRMLGLLVSKAFRALARAEDLRVGPFVGLPRPRECLAWRRRVDPRRAARPGPEDDGLERRILGHVCKAELLAHIAQVEDSRTESGDRRTEPRTPLEQL